MEVILFGIQPNKRLPFSDTNDYQFVELKTSDQGHTVHLQKYLPPQNEVLLSYTPEYM